MLGLSAYLIDDDLVCFPWRSCWSTSNALVWFWLSIVHVHAGRVCVCVCVGNAVTLRSLARCSYPQTRALFLYTVHGWESVREAGVCIDLQGCLR